MIVHEDTLTGGWGDANCGGNTGPYLKHAGWDGIMFFGAAPAAILDRSEQSILFVTS